jgi:hypothetical protein
MVYHFDISYDRRVSTGEHTNHIRCYPGELPSNGGGIGWHNIFYMVKGSETLFIGDEELDGRPGDVILIPAGYHCSNIIQRTPAVHTVFIRFSAIKGDHAEKPKIDGDQNNILTVATLMHSDNPAIFYYFNELVKNQISDTPYKSFKDSTLLNLLLVELSECYQIHALNTPPPP